MISKEIAQAVAKAVQDIMGSEFEVSARDVEKNNGNVLTGVTVKKQTDNIAPTVYIEDLYEQFGNDTQAIAEKIAELVKKQHDEQKIPVVDENELGAPEYIMKNAYVVLLNAEKNQTVRNESVCEDFLDLLAVVRIKVGEDGSYVLKKSLCQHAGIDENEIIKIAKENTKDSFEDARMSDVLSGMLGEDADILPDDGPDMIVCTSKSRVYGAAFMLYTDLIAKIAERKHDDLYILPSSIHECLALPASKMDPNDLAAMVHEVNSTQVAPEEVLSDSVYMYDRAAGMLKKVA